MINLGKSPIQVKDDSNNSVYIIPGGKRVNLDNYKSGNFLTVLDKDNCKIQQTMIYDISLILFNIQEVKDITKTAVFKDFFLMCGVPNKHQYLKHNRVKMFI